MIRWPWVSRKKYELIESLLSSSQQLNEAYQRDVDYYRAAYYDLRDIVAEQKEALDHHQRVKHYENIDMGDGPDDPRA